MNKLGPVYKLLLHIVSFVAVGAASVFDDGHISGVAEWCLVATALANAIVVWVVPELKKGIGSQAKAVAAIVITAAGVIPTLVIDGFTSADAYQLVFILVAAALTPVIPNVGYVPARKIVSPLTGGEHAAR